MAMSDQTTKMRGLEEELRKARDELESRVQERVTEMAKVNEALRSQIAERNLAQRALYRSEKSLSEAQRIAHIGNWDWDIQENVLRWSDEIYRIFGLTPQQFGATYETFLQSVHPEDRELVRKAVDEALYGRPYNIDHRIVLPNGEVRIVHEQGEVTFGESGEPIRLLGTVQDITEIKKAEEALLDAKAKYAAIVEGFDGFIYICSEKFDIEFMNERLIQRTGFDARGQKCYSIIHGLPDVCPWCEHNQTARDDIYRSEMLNPDDNCWYYIVHSPIHNQDGSVSKMVMFQDITEKKENEMRLIMSERLAALGQMASGIAHELNNPLATIAACAEGLISRLKRKRITNELLENYLKIITEEVARCKGITTSMLSFVRKTTYEKKEIDINSVLDKTVEIISLQGKLKNIEVVKNYYDNLVVHGSEGELKQVFLVIVMNALDAMEKGGRLTLETCIKDHKTIIRIGDTGLGISSEHMRRIFDPFFTTKSEKGGTGLGLSIAKKIIMDNNGRVDVTSTIGKGTTFTITFPR
jgi:PAS domain S-box-containing protein